jgi:hypothetical protein
MAMIRRAGQCTAETSIAIGVALLLLFACFRVGLWFCERYVLRQVRYEQSRDMKPAAANRGVVMDFEKDLPRMNLFNEKPAK